MAELSKVFAGLINIIDKIIVPLIFAVAFLVFLWGVYQYFIQGAGNEEKRKEGRTFVIYGIIGFFIMVSLWGIVNLFVNTFGFNKDSRPDLPQFNGGGATNNVNQNASANAFNPGGAEPTFQATQNTQVTPKPAGASADITATDPDALPAGQSGPI